MFINCDIFWDGIILIMCILLKTLFFDISINLCCKNWSILLLGAFVTSNNQISKLVYTFIYWNLNLKFIHEMHTKININKYNIKIHSKLNQVEN